MHLRHRACSLGLLLMTLAASPAAAQRRAPPRSEPTDWSHGTTLTAAAGVAADGDSTGAAAGGAIGWELTPRLSIEGSGQWVDRSGGADAFNAAMKVRAGLRRSNVAPFVEAGFGLYHVSVVASEPMPEFYRRRIDEHSMSSQSMTDPVFHVGGGVAVFTSRHLSLNPALEALIVRRDSHTYTLAVASLRVSYHFEDHPVTR